MRVNKNLAILTLSIIVCFIVASCNRMGPFKPSYFVASGTAIGKETCNADTVKDYWLIEIASSPLVRQQYGDTLTLNGIKYFNVIKTTGLPAVLKTIGQKVGIDFKMASAATLTANCSVNNPIIYKLKVVEVVNSGHSLF
ncbi:hypothetical protein [Pedobacter foliorum]|uniref:hypothetical protein n=1 Tax=Pedobacter foliorum TaxID=2739058 RepID=UPI0015644A2A|nr:hypothetical protein [Pedobacter foliorum]NRF38024.1 hypothetical protein [Pedobacter foliorum]